MFQGHGGEGFSSLEVSSVGVTIPHWLPTCEHDQLRLLAAVVLLPGFKLFCGGGWELANLLSNLNQTYRPKILHMYLNVT